MVAITITGVTLGALVEASGGAPLQYAKRLKRGFWVGAFIYESKN